MAKAGFAIGVDLGGTKIEMAAIDSEGNILERERKATDVAGGHTAIEAQIIEGVKVLRGRCDSDPVGVGVGVAGQIDSETGLVHFAPNLSWKDVPLRDNLKKEIGLPVAIVNDVRAASWGEWIHGAGKGCDDFVAIFLGTGIGSGIVTGGKMLNGSTNSAGEIGHMTIDLYGPSCTCGNRGCFEAIAGGWAIARSGKEAVITAPGASDGILKLVQGDEEAITAKIVIQAARDADPLARGVIDKVLEALVAGSVGIVNAFNPKRLIFGGGILKGLPEIIEVVEMGVKERALNVATESLEVVNAKLDYEAPVIGAATFAMKTLGDK